MAWLRFVVFVCAIGLGACGTLFGESSQIITFTSRPEGAEVLLDATPIGRTPLQYEVEKKTFSTHNVTIRQDGYESRTFTLSKTLDSIALLNCTSWLSWGTDALTGGMIEYDPQSYFLELKATPAAQQAPVTVQLPIDQRRELAFVLGTHRTILTDVARGDGEHLRTLATVMRVPAERYPDFTAAMGAALPALVHEVYPTRLYAAMVRVVEREGLSTAARVPMHPPALTLLPG